MPQRIVSIRQYDMKSVNLYDSTAMSVQWQASPPAGFILVICPFLSMFSNPWGIVYACKETMISPQMQPFQSEWQLVEACGSPWQSRMAYARRSYTLTFAPKRQGCVHVRPCRQWHSLPNPSEGGFLCPQRHSKVCFGLPETFRVTPGSLAPQGGWLPLRSREASCQPAVCAWKAELVP